MTSTIKVDNIQKTSDGSNIIKKCGSTITIGSSGQTVAVACGATTSGMGRTGAVDWCTTAKTSPFTSANGVGYFVNTNAGTITVTLPSSPSAGDIVAFKDYANTWDDNNVTVCRNGSKINGSCGNATLNTEDQSVTLVYVDGTRGWKTVNDSTSDVTGGAYITATGGTITTVDTNFKVHTFTSSGTFCVSGGGGPLAKIDYMVVAGGGGGGSNHGAGGGAGGFREAHCSTTSGPYTASPLSTPVSLQGQIGSFPITVGAGGAGGVAACGNGVSGNNSVFDTITSTGGGRGATAGGPTTSQGLPGGSGGGGTYNAICAGTGNQPPVSPPQGNPGGNGIPYPPGTQGGGGGATAAGVIGAPSKAGDGGAGATTDITGSPVARAGGGGGGETSYGATSPGAGGTGGGGEGSTGPGAAGSAGTANTGGGGGGGFAAPGTNGGAGGSGIVVIRYRFQ